MMTRTPVAVNRNTTPLPPPPWSEILNPYADRIPFPTVCGCAVYRHRRGGLITYYAAHEAYTCSRGRTDADLAVGAAVPVAVPRLMVASVLCGRHVDEVYAAIRAARVEVTA